MGRQIHAMRVKVTSLGNHTVTTFEPDYSPIAEPYDDELWECSNCGVLTREEVQQVERHECCIEACVYCNRDAHPIR